MSELKSILAVREPLYRRADATIDTSHKSLETTLENLVAATQSQPPVAQGACLSALRSFPRH